MGIISSWPINILDIATDGKALREAVKNKHTDIWEDLLSRPDINPNLTDAQGASLLHTACRWNNSDAVVELLSSGKVALNGKDELSYTPVMWAARMGNTEVLRVMLAEPGVKIDGIGLADIAKEACDGSVITKQRMKEMMNLVKTAENKRRDESSSVINNNNKRETYQGDSNLLTVNRKLRSGDFDASFTNSPGPRFGDEKEKVTKLSQNITIKMLSEDCDDDLEKEVFAGDFMLTSPPLRSAKEKADDALKDLKNVSNKHQKSVTTNCANEQKSKVCISVQVEGPVDKGLKEIAEAIAQNADVALEIRKKEYLELKFKKEEIEKNISEVEAKIKINRIKNESFLTSDLDDDDILEGENDMYEEKLASLKEDLRRTVSCLNKQ